MKIGTVARMAGVGVETVRYYERRGLIQRPRRPEAGGFRSYPPDTVARIGFVRQAQRLGFSLVEVTELLSLQADPEAACADIRARAEAKLGEVEDKIARLAEIRDALRALIEACPGTGVAARRCSILETLSPARDDHPDPSFKEGRQR